MTQSHFAPLLAAALLTAGVSAQAQAVDLTTATTYGDVTATSANAILTTAGSGETPPSGTSALLYYDLEPVLLPDGGSLDVDTLEGSALAYEFTLASPGTVSFDWTLSTAETWETHPVTGLPLLDRAFVSFDGSVSTLANASLAPQSGSYLSGLLGAGTHRFSVGVMDVNDVLGVSTLGVSHLSVNVSAVPEPHEYALLLAGLTVVAGAARRRGQRG